MSAEALGSNSEINRSKVIRYNEQLDALASDARFADDPVIAPLVAQHKNHLKHISYSFKVKGDPLDFPYDLQRTEPFPQGHTEWTYERADNMLALAGSYERSGDVPHFDAAYGEAAKQEQANLVHRMLDNPMATYDDFTERRQAGGDEAPFPELGHTLKALATELSVKPEVLQACEGSPLFAEIRNNQLRTISDVIEQNEFGYKSTLRLIEDTMAVFDLVIRSNKPDSPAPYHTARFEYNWHTLSEDSELTVIPTMTSLSLVDLVRLRSVPVGLIGVSTNTLTVDGFPQTPYEFFHHDVDHTRRMHQETMSAIEREGMTSRAYAERATNLMNKLLALVDVDHLRFKSELTTEEMREYDELAARLLVLFEILHEDGYDASPDSIADAIVRPPMEHTPFEHESSEGVIEHYMGPRASLLAHVYRKIAHSFYDTPEHRSGSLGSDFVRTRSSIIDAAVTLYRAVSDDPISDEDLRATCTNLVSTDEGFTDAFIGNFAHDISRRAVAQNALRLMVARPLNVNTAIRRINREQDGMHVHSLFGYSALDYEDPDALDQMIEEDLREMSPDEIAIAIGATPYGIGRAYRVAKDMGFRTLGIVSSTALGANEECAIGVDKVYVVKDTNWGGQRYSASENGLLSPTTRVFIGASDSLKAYGGGGITAATMKEAVRRGKPFEFAPFDMKHRYADMMQAQGGSEGEIEYSGPANNMWRELNKAES